MSPEQRDSLIQSTHDAVIAIEERYRACHADVVDLQRVIYGNSHIGIKDRVLQLESAAKGRNKWLGWAASGFIAIIASIVTVLGERLLR